MRAIVTGAASGIGRATALRLGADGYDVIVVDRDAAALDRLRAELADARTVTTDLSRRTSAVAAVADELRDDDIDVLVNCAGIGWPADVGDTTADVWDTTVAVNLTATFAMCQLVLPRMLARGFGVIINMASAGALVGLKRRAAYCATKAGVVGLTRAIAADHAAQGIRVNAICPGTVDTPWINRMLRDVEEPGAVRRQMEQRQLDGRMGTAEEVAEWIAFVASDKGRFMNGATLVIDGGLTAV